MIKKAFWLFGILLGSIWLGAMLKNQPNYVLISWGGWSIETTLWLVIPFLILCFALFHGIIVFFASICRIPSVWRHWHTQRRLEHAQAETRRGLIEFSEGHWKIAEKHLINALPNTDTPLLNYLTAARAAQELGDSTLRDDYLRQAQQSNPEANVAIELTQAQFQLANQQWEQARATLKHLQDLTPNHPYVLKLLMQLYEALSDWSSLIMLLPLLKKFNVLSPLDFEKKQQHFYQEALSIYIKQKQIDQIEDLVKDMPNSLRYQGEITALYAGFLIDQQQEKLAEKILHKSLQKNVNEACLKQYSKLSEKIADLAFIESLTSKATETSNVHRCLGHLCVSQQLWGRARVHFEESIKGNPSIEAYFELGELYEQIKQNDLARKAYKSGLADVLATKR